MNLVLGKDTEDLKKTREADVPVHYIPKEEIEQVILRNKDIAEKGGYNLFIGKIGMEEKKLIEDIKQDIKSLNLETKKPVLPRQTEGTTNIESKMHVLESHHHYDA